MDLKFLGNLVQMPIRPDHIKRYDPALRYFLTGCVIPVCFSLSQSWLVFASLKADFFLSHKYICNYWSHKFSEQFNQE